MLKLLLDLCVALFAWQESKEKYGLVLNVSSFLSSASSSSVAPSSSSLSSSSSSSVSSSSATVAPSISKATSSSASLVSSSPSSSSSSSSSASTSSRAFSLATPIVAPVLPSGPYQDGQVFDMLEKYLRQFYDQKRAVQVVQQFKQQYEQKLQRLSLDDIEMLATEVLKTSNPLHQ